jgi:hypothetical protein
LIKKDSLNTKEKRRSLNYLLSSVIDEVMKDVLGDSGAKAVYSFFENNFNLKREDLAERTCVFSNGLNRILGPNADLVLKTILNNLYDKLELKFSERRGYEFSDYIKELRERHS